MDTREQLQRLFAYDDWANQQAVASLRNAASPTRRGLGLLAHIVAAERLWWGRLQQDGKPVEAWPELTLEECAGEWAELAPRWRDILRGLSADRLSQSIPYRNTKGESWVNSVEEILLHVVLHSAYHRGQLAAELRASGNTPANTDFIHAVRQGWVK